MDDCPAKLKIIPDHFQIPNSSIESIESSQSRQLSTSEESGIDQSLRYCLRVKIAIIKKLSGDFEFI